MITEPWTVLPNGTRVRTYERLGTVDGFIIGDDSLENRRGSVEGKIIGVVGGHGGDFYWVTHDDDTVAPYCWSEFNLIDYHATNSKIKERYHEDAITKEAADMLQRGERNRIAESLMMAVVSSGQGCEVGDCFNMADEFLEKEGEGKAKKEKPTPKLTVTVSGTVGKGVGRVPTKYRIVTDYEKQEPAVLVGGHAPVHADGQDVYLASDIDPIINHTWVPLDDCGVVKPGTYTVMMRDLCQTTAELQADGDWWSIVYIQPPTHILSPHLGPIPTVKVEELTK